MHAVSPHRLRDAFAVHAVKTDDSADYRNRIHQIQQGTRLSGEEIDLLSGCHPITLVKCMLSQGFDALCEWSLLVEFYRDSLP